MIIQKPESQITVWQAARRNTAFGALVGVDIFLLTMGIMNGIYPAADLLALSLVIGTGFSGISVYAINRMQQRLRSIKPIEKELAKARQLVNKELITEEDYQALKSRTLESYRPTQLHIHPFRQAAPWGGVIGLTLALVMFAIGGVGSNPITAAMFWAFLVASGVVGGTAVGGLTIGYFAAQQRVTDHQLPGGVERPRLGE